jgi:PncC family amidohydrolase
MAGIIPTMKEADVIFLGTPLYFNTMSGTLKVFVDRLTALGGNPHELKDRKSVKTKLVMASNCGYPIKEQFAALSLWIRHFCNMLDVELVGEFYTTQGKALTQPDAEVEDARARYIRYLQECGSSLLRFGTLSAEQKDKMSNSVLDFCKVPPKHRSGVCWARRLRMTQSGFESIVAEIASLAVAKGLTVATAESCTGGLVSARLVDWAGASAFFLEGAVTYSNEAKAARLDVRPETLARHGAVSAETAREMAEGVARRSGASVGVSTTGIAGPDGGTPEKPVGLVYVGVFASGAARAERFLFKGTRNEIREQTVRAALEILRSALKDAPAADPRG